MKETTTLRDIEKLILSRHYDEALKACDEMQERRAEVAVDLSRLRSWIFSSQAKYQCAVKELEAIIDAGIPNLSDLHSAALWSLHGGELAKAGDLLEIVLLRGKEINDHWYDSSAIFYSAYVSMEQNQFEKATQFLNRLGADCDESETMLLPLVGSVTPRALREEIKRRAARFKGVDTQDRLS